MPHYSVEGVDIDVPVYHFSETHYLPLTCRPEQSSVVAKRPRPRRGRRHVKGLPDAIVTPAYSGTQFNLTGKVNGGAFKGFAAGECLFLGAAGAKRGSGDWPLTQRPMRSIAAAQRPVSRATRR